MRFADHTYCKHLKLRNAHDLEELREEYQDCSDWIIWTEIIFKAAQEKVSTVTSTKEH